MRMNSGKETSFFDRARWVHEYAPGSYTMLYDSEVETYLTEFQKKQEDFHISTVLSGESYALDGHLLLVNVSSTMRTRIYTAPVRVNREKTTYTFVVKKFHISKRPRVLYTCLGGLVDENGLPARESGHLRSGDYVVAYTASDETGERLNSLEEFQITEDNPLPELIPLPEGSYCCQYIVTDVIGRKKRSDYCLYDIMEKDGERSVKAREIVK